MKLWNWIAENAIMILTGYLISELYTWRQWQAYASLIGVAFLLAVHDACVKHKLENK